MIVLKRDFETKGVETRRFFQVWCCNPSIDGHELSLPILVIGILSEDFAEWLIVLVVSDVVTCSIPSYFIIFCLFLRVK